MSGKRRPPTRRIDLARRRLQDLLEITRQLASFESLDRTFDAALGVVAKTLALRSAALIEAEGGHYRMILWPSKDQNTAAMREARAYLEKSFAWFVGAPSSELDVAAKAGASRLPSTRKRRGDDAGARRFMVIPLVTGNRAVFGALQLESAKRLREPDLVFANALANQLAIALDRDHAWQRDIEKRDAADVARVAAESARDEAERGRVKAEAESERQGLRAAGNRELYERAERAMRAREQILAVVSHDLRNPLGTILLSCDELAALREQGGRPAASLERIQRAAERMQRQIDDLLDFASIEAGHLSIRTSPHEARRLVEDTLAAFAGIAREKGLRLESELATGLPPIPCDDDRILQVLANLVGNATKATGRGGRVTIRVEPRGQDVLFAVADTGPGIRSEDIGHLFERYWRAQDARYKGTGLGLAIASGLVAAHGGRIWAESEPGRGATFFFTLPVATDVALPQAPP